MGHGDLVQLADGSWYMVALASRLIGGHRILGRETFIAPVDWSGEWPVVSPGTGRVEWEYPAPNLPACPVAAADQDDFRALCWNTLGTPEDGDAVITADELTLRAFADWFVPDALPRNAAPNGCPGFYGRRQQHADFSAEVTLARCSGMAGLMVLQNGFNSLSVARVETEKGSVLRAIRNEKCGKPDYENPREYPREVKILWEAPFSGDSCRLGLHAEGLRYWFTINGETVAETDGGFLGSETAGGFVGAYVGCFVSGVGAEAVFSSFSYQGK